MQKFTQIYFLKEKSEVKHKLENFLNQAKIYGHSIKELLRDGSKEFVNSNVKRIIEKNGIMSLYYNDNFISLFFHI